MADRINTPEHLGPVAHRNGTNGVFHAAKNDSEGDEISLHEILEVVFKNKWIILASFVLVMTATALYTLRQSPEYEASSTVYVNMQQGSNPQLGEMLGLETFNRNLFNEIEIIKSRKIATRVAEQLIQEEVIPGTSQRLTLLGSANDPSNVVEVAKNLRRRIHVEPVTRGVDIIQLTATSTIPEEAVLISTLYASEYRDYNRELSRSRMKASREFLNDVTDKYSQELITTENNLTDFLNREQVVAPDEEARQLLSRVSDLEAVQNQTRLELASARAEIGVLESQLEQIKPGLVGQINASGENLAINNLLREIANLDAKIENKYARNPGLKDNPSQDPELARDLQAISALRAKVYERSQSLVDGVLVNGNLGEESSTGSSPQGFSTLARLQRQIMDKKIEASALEARTSILAQQRGVFTSKIREIPRKDVILSRLERDRQTTEQLYIALEEKLQEARIAEMSELGYVDVVDEAIVPDDPVRPNVKLNLMFGALFGLVFGLSMAFIRSAMDNRIRKPEDLRRRGHTVAGIISDMERAIKQDFNGKESVVVDGQVYDTRLISLLNPLSPVAEGYRRLRTNIQYSRPDGESRVILVTSPGPSEGKTVTSLNLAVTIAQSGLRTLYLDMDLRRPQGHKMMGLRREPGVVDLLFDSVPDNVEQFAATLDNFLYVIPAGRDVPNPAEVLGSRKMQTFLAHWRKKFDVIIIDTPPTLVVADALIMVPQSNGVLVVSSAGSTNWQSVDRCTEALYSVGANLIGVVLNRFDAKAAYGGYKYGYGYGYEYGYGNYYYYGQDAPEKGKRKIASKS